MNPKNILEVRDLVVKFKLSEGIVHAVNGVSYDVPEGKSIGIVGESGCGKTVSSYALNRLLPPYATLSGQILFRQQDGNIIDIAKLKPEGREIRAIRGRDIAMIFQEPMTSLSPVHTICNQISEALILFQGMTKKQARNRTIELLKLVGIPQAERRVDEYPFQFSGGMRQRAMIAMALARNPRVLIADEPTTALDVTLQAQVLSLIQDLQNRFNLSMILITHALGVVAHMVETVNIMYLGRIVETGPTMEIFEEPLHPYTQGLLQSIPKLTGRLGERVSSIPGSVPSAYDIPKGCPFEARCKHRMEICREEMPKPVTVGSEHTVYCHLYTGREAARDAANA
ncbi:MAG: ABC transporter ATP-binding protein [Limnochordia bacterium]|jgi:peptide/nickel transport system ATP-binding protein|nr:ABC transporter ATP-binding protein [Bacillota bacterium]HOB09453.1 ABC transporter ATP-binding protein [Limnochordia bacterium]NLH31651.1 ABC transporter ATP-binding protein [Bacillota bacterium]HPT93574.1 ABC transporter ATP-binding protein [Limnochordia bacterium]HPZ31327.1 ABC transporter ATP-binding protein [Limnochordia bacterium]